MAAILGMRGSGNFGTPGAETSERPKNWREWILLLFPNGEAPLTAFLSKLSDKPADDPEYNWWEKGMPQQRTLINNGAGYGAGIVAMTVTAGTGVIFKKNHVVLVERTNELMICDQDGTANAIHVLRGKGEVAAAAIVDTDPLLIVGTAYEEGAKNVSIVSYTPTKQFNYTQIFRTALGMTRTAKKTRLRWDKTGPYREAKREALQLHAIEMEKAFLFGQRLEEIGPDGQPRRMTRGMFNWITTNKLKDGDNDGVWGDKDFDAKFEEVFRYGSTEKLGLIGSTALVTINAWAKRSNSTRITMTSKDSTYGMKIVEILTPFGTLYLRNHPLFSDHPVFRKDCMILDTDKLTYRYIDDTTFKKNTQAPDEDASKDEFLTECGLEVDHEKAHAWLQNMASYDPAE